MQIVLLALLALPVSGLTQIQPVGELANLERDEAGLATVSACYSSCSLVGHTVVDLAESVSIASLQVPTGPLFGLPSEDNEELELLNGAARDRYCATYLSAVGAISRCEAACTDIHKAYGTVKENSTYGDASSSPIEAVSSAAAYFKTWFASHLDSIRSVRPAADPGGGDLNFSQSECESLIQFRFPELSNGVND